MKYKEYEYCLSTTLLVDQDKKVYMVKRRLDNSIYEIKEIEISKHKINGLIKRLNNDNYSFENSFVIDDIIYNHLMTDEQKNKCVRKPSYTCKHIQDHENMLQVN